MIRGILLLILSCVVLTLQSTCTCDANAKPSVCEKADDFYPAPSTYGIDLTQKPSADTTELAACYSKIASKTLLKDTTTSGIQKMEDDGKASLLTVTAVVDGLLATKAQLLQEIALINVTIDSDCRNLYDMVDVITDPLVAVDHCTKSLYIISRRQYLDRVLRYLDVKISVKVNLKALWGKYLEVVGIALSLSRTVDGLVSNCILSPLFCKRDGIVTGLALTLTSPLTTAVLTLGNTLSGFSAETAAKITADPNLFLKLIDIDLKHNILRSHLHTIWALIEQVRVHTFIDIQQIIHELTHSVENVLWLIRGLFYKFSLGPTTQFICTGYNDPSSKLISCTLTSKIIADVSVSVGNVVDINLNVATKLAHICRVVMLALTGSLNVDTKVVSLAADGTVVIEMLWKRDCHDLLGIVYQIPEVINVCGISSILTGGKVNEGILTIIEQIEDPELALSTTSNTIADTLNVAISATSSVITPILYWIDGLGIRISARITALESLYLSVSLSDIAQLVFDRCVVSKNEELEVLRLLLPKCENSILQAELKVVTCQNAMAKAKIELEAHPNDPRYQERYTKCHQAYMESLRLAVQVKVQATSIRDTIQAQIGIATSALDTLKVGLQANLDGIISGVFRVLAALRIDIELNIDLYITRIIACIKAFRPSCGIIDIRFPNLAVVTDLDIRIEIRIADVLLEAEVLEDMRNCHRTLARAAAILCLGHTNVRVEDAPVVIGSNEYTYTVYVS